MSDTNNARGGAAVAVLSRMEAWEANTVLNLRLWCEGPTGQKQVWNEFRSSLPGDRALDECRAFEDLIVTITRSAHRPLVRHDVGCSCVGSDECVFLHLIRTASEGHLTDAALIATLLIGPAKAEHVAILAGQVGACARRIHNHPLDIPNPESRNVVRIH